MPWSVGDGEAYFLTVTPNTTAGTFPPSGDVNSPAPSGASTPTQVLREEGSEQSAPILHQFGQRLVAMLTDQYGNPMANTQLTFLVANNYAKFSNGTPSYTVTTDANGMATSLAITAKIVGGKWQATCYVTSLGAGAGEPVAYYRLTNTLT
jgi:hypothetical protein